MAAPKFTSRERMTVYRSLFLLNRSFHLIVQRLDDLKTLFTSQDLKDMQNLTQEMQLEINHMLLNKLDSIEEHDWSQFGKVRIALEKRLKSPIRSKPR